MNFLAHLVLAGENEGLRMGALLGDFVQGRLSELEYSREVRLGIRLHRHIDSYVDALPQVVAVRGQFHKPFRRYAGIILDLAYDHELALAWPRYCSTPITEFDRNVRTMLARNEDLQPEKLKRFMAYADRRGLFAAYAERSEILRALTGLGKRLSRANPLHRVDEIWDDLRPEFKRSFEQVFPELQRDAEAWLKSRSTMTGS